MVNKKEFGFSFNTNKELRGFANWQTTEETLESFKSDLYFLGYEKYEGIFIEVKVISNNEFIISLDSEYSFNYISQREKNLDKFFKNIANQVLNDDYIKLYSINSEKININNII